MIQDFSEYAIYLKAGATDMRKQINSLALLTQNEITQDVFEKKIFLFCNQSRTHLKILYWDCNGFCLWLKRLEKGRFPWPGNEFSRKELTYDELKMLLSGIDFFKAHQELKFSRVG